MSEPAAVLRDRDGSGRERPRTGRALLVALLAALSLAAASPPAWWPGAELLLLAGLALQFGTALSPRRALLASYLLGVVHMAMFSLSLQHVILVGFVFVALVGGLYYLLTALAVRACPRAPVLAFAVAVAAANWLRAEIPEIPYPHAQPCHAFWQVPWSLGAVRIGGEPLANALLAAIGAGLWQLARSWRIGVPAWRAARRRLAIAVFLFALPMLLALPTPPSERAQRVAVAAIEPGVHPTDPFLGRTSEENQRVWLGIFRERLLAPTLRAAGEDVANAPALVLWPESSLRDAVSFAAGDARFTALRGLALAPGTRLCVGAGAERGTSAEGRPLDTPAAVLVDHLGRYLGHQEKRVRVPGGETLPFVALLPAAIAAWLRHEVRASFGYDPEVPPGQDQPLLRTADGVPFGALICYDNAFHGPVAAEVEKGARFLAVLSNEAWYRGGNELPQLAAITVVRALACAVPFVRCTTDGLTMAVDADGRVLAGLPLAPAPQPAARILQVDLPLGSGRLPPLARWHPWWGRAALLLVAVLLLHALWARVRLLGLDRPAGGGVGASPRSDPPEGGS